MALPLTRHLNNDRTGFICMPPGYSTVAGVACVSGNVYVIKYVAPCTEKITSGQSKGHINVSTAGAGSNVTISVYTWDYTGGSGGIGNTSGGGPAAGNEGGLLLGSTSSVSSATTGHKSSAFTSSFWMYQGNTYWISAFVAGGSPSFTGITIGSLSSSILGNTEIEMGNFGGQFVPPASLANSMAYTSAVPLMAINPHGG